MKMKYGLWITSLALLLTCRCWPAPADVEIWPYEPVAVWIPLNAKPDGSFRMDAEIKEPDNSTSKVKLLRDNVIGFIPDTRRALVVIFNGEDLHADTFVAPGRYEIKIDSNPQKTTSVDVKQLPESAANVASLLKENLLFRVTRISQGGGNNALRPIFERVLTETPQSPYAPYAQVYLAVERFYAGQNVDKEHYLGRRPPDLSNLAQELVRDLATPLPTSSWPLRGMILYHIGVAQAMAGNRSAARSAFGELQQQLPVSMWSDKADEIVAELHK